MSALAEASIFARRIAPKGARSWSRALPTLEVSIFDLFLFVVLVRTVLCSVFHTCFRDIFHAWCDRRVGGP